MNIRRLARLIRPFKPATQLVIGKVTPALPAKAAMRFLSTTAKTLQFAKHEIPIAQGIKGDAVLITGNFSYFTKYERDAIKRALINGNAYIIVFDRDSISVPANERAMWIREHFHHHPNLEVRVVYGSPSENTIDASQYISYIKKHLPNHLSIKSVYGGHFYSKLLAQALNAPLLPLSDIKDMKSLEESIRQNPTAYSEVLLPEVANRVIYPFRDIIDPVEFEALIEGEEFFVRYDTKHLNPNHPNEDPLYSFYKATRWNLDNLNRVNLPVIIGRIDDPIQQAKFSNLTNTQVFDMPIYMPNQGWKIPVELAPHARILAKIAASESYTNHDMSKCNAYVTIDCGVVPPNGYARREGLHVDGFLTKANQRPVRSDGIVWGDNTYVMSDSQELQTEFYPGPFDLSQVDKDNPQAVLNAFEEQGKHMAYKQYNAYDIARITTNNVHAVHQNDTGRYLQRCFIKVTFSDRLFNRSGNTVNPNFNYRFIYVPRSNGRNTQNFAGAAPEGFIEVDIRKIDFNNPAKFPSWTSAELLTVRKNPDVCITATPAKEGDVLETKVDGDVVTMNIARANDMKVTRDKEDSYFLGNDFFKLYKPTGEKNKYVPTDRTLKAVRVTENITFTALWGMRQNIRKGGFIVQDEKGETWGVHGKSFAATYQQTNRRP